jgi:anti-sigma-K factor RskA
MTAPDDDDDVLAAEYLLGLLEGPELAGAEARALADPIFAGRVEAWSTRLAPMLTGSPVEPPVSVWQNIASRLAANDDELVAAERVSVRRWRLSTLGASAVAAGLALVLLTRSDPEPQPPRPASVSESRAVLVASLQDDETNSAITVAVESAGQQLLVTPVRLSVEGRSPELWIIPGDGTPRSLGLIETAAPSRVSVPGQHRAHIHAGATFAISLEPIGGSPTGAPTGPIAASGEIHRV